MEAGHIPCAHVALGLCLSAGHIPAYTWRLGFCVRARHTLRTRGSWAMPQCWAHPCVHVALGLCLSAGHIPAYTWHLGYASVLGTPCAHVALGLWWARPIGDKWWLGHGSGLKGNELSIWTHDQWV
jgi:hypothetical protein